METTPENFFDEEFLLIWSAMQANGIAPLAVAGGYGLLLKQRWLSQQASPDILVPFERWTNPNPRATKDFDLVIDLDFLKDEKSQELMTDLLKKLEYVVTAENPRWQFEKSITENKKIIVEFHAESPAADTIGLESCRIRVKRKPSLNEKGIHARKNPEAIGCNESPFTLPIQDQEILLPNPITWSIMKLTALADQLGRSREPDRTSESRTFCQKQAEKHAEDVCRIVAMISSGEADQAVRVASVLRADPAFDRAVKIVKDLFSDDGDGTMMTEKSWEADDHGQIRELLNSWFTR
jgi:hypothetical protein